MTHAWQVTWAAAIERLFTTQNEKRLSLEKILKDITNETEKSGKNVKILHEYVKEKTRSCAKLCSITAGLNLGETHKFLLNCSDSHLDTRMAVK